MEGADHSNIKGSSVIQSEEGRRGFNGDGQWNGNGNSDE